MNLTFGEAVTVVRKRRDRTQQWLADQVGVCLSYIVKIERGAMPGGHAVRARIADALDDDEVRALVRREDAVV